MDFPKLITNAADLKVALTKLYSTPETGLEVWGIFPFVFRKS